MRVEACLVFPDLGRSAVIAIGLETLHADRKQGRKLLGGLINDHHRGVDSGLVIRLLALDHRAHSACVLSGVLHDGLGRLDQILLGHYGANTKQQGTHNYDSSHHWPDPPDFIEKFSSLETFYSTVI